MINIIEKSKCTGCSACANICPKNCIEMIRDEEGFLYPQINFDICGECGICEKICPVANFEYIKDDTDTIAYAVINKNNDIRKKSSSGGVFTLLAEQVLDNNGVVFGAAFDKNFLVKHISVENKEELDKLRGSKYLQSDVGDTYTIAKANLDNGRQVLYSGTPCQIAGLLSFLKKPYKNLITVDLICHGVPSPRLWKLVYLAGRPVTVTSLIRLTNGSIVNLETVMYSMPTNTSPPPLIRNAS